MGLHLSIAQHSTARSFLTYIAIQVHNRLVKES